MMWAAKVRSAKQTYLCLVNVVMLTRKMDLSFGRQVRVLLAPSSMKMAESVAAELLEGCWSHSRG